MNPVEEVIGHGTDCQPFEETAASAAAARQNPFLDRLGALYEKMDRRYTEIADRYGFHCRGCEDSCCKTVFYHHTLVEYLYIEVGIHILGRAVQEKVLHRSREVAAAPDHGHFCPLIEDGRCLLYAYRPMICRLHGIAHELHRPDGTVHRGPGCHVFDVVSRGKSDIVFDRTPFYWELSTLEKEVRAAYGFSQKTKMTISQMMETILQPKPSKESSSHETD